MLARTWEGAAQGFGSEPLGFSQENRQKYPQTYLTWQPFVAPLDAAARLPGAAIGAGASLMGGAYQALGGNEADSRRLERDANMLGQTALLAPGLEPAFIPRGAVRAVRRDRAAVPADAEESLRHSRDDQEAPREPRPDAGEIPATSEPVLESVPESAPTDAVSKLDPAETAKRDAERTNTLPPIAARLTGDELGEPRYPSHLRLLARQYAEENFLGRSVTNADTGVSIGFNRSGLKKATSGKRGPDLLRLVPALPEMLARGRYMGTEADMRGRRNVRAVHQFAATVDLGGKTFDTISFVRETDDGRFFYDYGILRGPGMPGLVRP